MNLACQCAPLQIDSDSATFVVPVSSSQGYRTLFAAGQDYSHIELQQPATPIYSLSVEFSLPGGDSPNMTDEWFIVLSLTY